MRKLKNEEIKVKRERLKEFLKEQRKIMDEFKQKTEKEIEEIEKKYETLIQNSTPQSQQNENSNQPSASPSECPICMDNKVDTALIPCVWIFFFFFFYFYYFSLRAIYSVPLMLLNSRIVHFADQKSLQLSKFLFEK